MALVITMATSLDKTHWARKGSLRIRDPLCSASTLSLTFRDMHAIGGYRPAIDDDVLVENPIGTPIFHGAVVSPEESGRKNILSIQIDARGMARRCDERFVLKTYAAAADPDTVVTDLVTTYLAADGIWFTAVIGATGTLPALPYDYRQLTEVLNELCALLGNLVWRIAPTDELQVFKPGTGAPAWSIAEGDGHIQGEPRRRKSRTNYANTVILRFGQGQRWIDNEAHAGNGVTRIFALDVPAATVPNIVTVPGPVYHPVCIYPDTSTAWAYRASDNSLYQRSDQTLIGGAESIYTNYTGAFPGTVVSVGSGAAVEIPLEEPTVFERVRAQALADAYRAQRQIDTDEFFYGTKTAGLAPGKSQAIVCARRGVNGTYLLTEVQTFQEANIERLRYEGSGILGTIYQGSWRDLAKSLGGGSGVTTVIGGGAVPTSGGVGFATIDLGGSRRDPIIGTAATYYELQQARPFRWGGTAHAGHLFTLLGIVRSLHSAVSVTLGIYNLLTGALISGTTTTPVSETVDTAVELTVSAPASATWCVCKVTPGVTNEPIWATAYLGLTR
jgi:hypothetical protein